MIRRLDLRVLPLKLMQGVLYMLVQSLKDLGTGNRPVRLMLLKALYSILMKKKGYSLEVISGMAGPLVNYSKILLLIRLYRLLSSEAPEIVVDCVNTATGIAYQDIYRTSRQAWDALRQDGDLQESLEMLLVTDYVPQLIRHVQVLYQSMMTAGTGAYLKIGTSGTGGMGLNVPFTHSEERPSATLLSKSSASRASSRNHSKPDSMASSRSGEASSPTVSAER